MSDDRIDRAERIRNMREGNRGTDEEPAETTDSEADNGDSDSTASEETTTTSSTESAAETQSAASQQTESTPTTEQTPSTEADSAPDDASTAAQRAAASAAEVMGSGGAETPTNDAGTGADAGDGVAGGGGLMGQGPTGVELPDQQLLEEAMENSTVQSTEGGARAAIEGETTQAEELVRVLEFSLGDEYYCLDIEYVEEIVKRSAVTRVPNTPDFVDGVVDLRGQITTILEPKEMMDIEAEGEQNLIIVFDPDQFEEQGAVGWVVDEVRQVVPVTESEVNSPPVDAAYINGVVDREEYDQFVIWVEPDDALAQATSTDDE